MIRCVTRTLGEICDDVGGIIRTGPFGTQLHQSDYSEEGTPVVMPQNIADGKVSVEDIARIRNEDVNRLLNHRLQVGDIVYGRRGDIGRRALITKKEEGWLCGTGSLRISLGKTVIDPKFLYYYLGQLHVINLIYNNAIGATLPNLNTSIIRRIPITYPPLPTQRKTAAILSAYDDLIENNLQRITILEEMAKNLYRDWFVNFCFPGYETVKMMDSELGMIPEGWNYESILKSPFFDLIEDNVKPYVGKMKYFATADVNRIELEGKGIEYYFKDKPSRAQKQPVLYSVWFARMQDTYKVLAFTPINNELALHSMLSSGFVGFKTRFEQSFPFLYCTIGSEEFHKLKDLYCTGATQRSLTNEGMRHIEVVVPTNDVVLEFGRCVQPMLDQLLILQQKNIILRQCRDLLLPKLISGQIDVSDLDIKVEEDA